MNDPSTHNIPVVDSADDETDLLDDDQDIIFLGRGDKAMDVRAADTLLTGQAGIVERIEELSRDLSEMRGTLQEVASSGRENNRLDELHWREHVIGPLVNQMFPILDLAARYSSRRRVADTAVREAFAAVTTMLRDLLQTYEIEAFVPELNAPFDPKSMKVVQADTTDDATLDGRVRARRQVGFRRGKENVLRPASVVVWKYEATASSPVNFIEGR